QNPRGADVDHPVFYGPGGVKAGRNDVAGNGAYTHLTVLAINETGLKNLFALSKLSGEHKYVKPRIDFDMLANHNEGLVVFTGCPSSEMSIRILLDQYDEAQQWVSQLKDVFGPE
ncbi:PHP domain-containing protein, partial [Acinetobacter baumannii]|nr:PHP domain-containing protein [Acinetobacter baumannii]